jgi:hypothetical protein
MVKENIHEKESAGSPLTHRLDALGWGLFFIWLGYVLLANVSSGIALLGIGVIIWGGQLARLSLKLGLEGFWAVVGTGFVLGGVWQILGSQLPLFPVLLILAGLAVIFTAFLRRGHRAGIWSCCASDEPKESLTHKSA